MTLAISAGTPLHTKGSVFLFMSTFSDVSLIESTMRIFSLSFLVCECGGAFGVPFRPKTLSPPLQTVSPPLSYVEPSL